jgi:hypothetical protein
VSASVNHQLVAKLSLYSVLVVFMADLEFELGHTSLQVEQVLLQVGLLCLKGSDLLLQLSVLALLPVVALLHLVFGAEDLLSESLADVSSFTGKHILKRFLLRSQGLNLLLIEVQLLIHATDGLLQGVDFALQGG